MQTLTQNWFPLWELTKRELKRKYARSYLGILWSIFYPMLRMALVVFMFSTVFNKGIDKYPAYYFVGFLLYEFLNTATSTSLTTLRDNEALLYKSRMPRSLLVLSRVMTAFLNTMLGFIPFLLILLWYHVRPTHYLINVIFILFFYFLFVTGWSYILSIVYVVFPDIRNIHSNFLMILRFFVCIFYSIEWVSPAVQAFIRKVPVYAVITLSRESVIYGTAPDMSFVWETIIWGLVTYVAGKIIFCANEKKVLEWI